MRDFFKFIAESARRSVGASIVGGVLLAMGVNLRAITATFLTHPPAWVSLWWLPWLFVIAASLVFAYVFYRWATELERRSRTGVQSDMPIADAINYLVNGSVAKLKQPPPPQIRTEGPGKGMVEHQAGVPHNDARAQIQARLVSGELKIWGFRERIVGHSLLVFEDFLREIPQSYWEFGQLGFIECFHITTKMAQTKVKGGKSDYLYTGLLLSEQQVKAIWPRKSWLSRASDRRRGVVPVNYWNRPLDGKNYRPRPSEMAADNAPEPQQASNDEKWLSIHAAVDAYADPADLKGRDRALDWMVEAPEMREKAERAIAECRAIIASSSVNTAEVVDEATKKMAVEERRLRLAKIMESGERDLGFYWEQIRSDMQKKLESGALTARGFKTPHSAGAAEVTIPCAEWRFLQIDPTRDKAIGEGIEYISVRIMKEKI